MCNSIYKGTPYPIHIHIGIEDESLQPVCISHSLWPHFNHIPVHCPLWVLFWVSNTGLHWLFYFFSVIIYHLCFEPTFYLSRELSIHHLGPMGVEVCWRWGAGRETDSESLKFGDIGLVTWVWVPLPLRVVRLTWTSQWVSVSLWVF